MKLNLKFDEWTQVPYEKGIIQNTNEQATIEVNNKAERGGVVLQPHWHLSFSQKIFARSAWDIQNVNSV